MQEDRFIIFKMVEEGKINAAEAMALLEALEDEATAKVDADTDPKADPEAEPASTADEKRFGEAEGPSVGETKHQGNDAGTDGDAETGDDAKTSGTSSGPEGGDDTGKDSTAWGELSKEIGEHIRESVQFAMKNLPQLSQELKETWHSVKEDVKRSVSEVRDEVSRGVTLDIGGIKHVLYRGRPEFSYVERITGTVGEHVPSFDALFRTQNGGIAVRGWDRSDYEIVVRQRVWGFGDDAEAREAAQEVMQVEQGDDRISVHVHPHERISVSIEANVPKSQLGRVEAITRNGGLVIEAFQAARLKALTLNGGISISDVKVPTMHVDTTNGRVLFEDVDAEEVYATTTNGAVTWAGTAQNVDFKTTNGAVKVEPRVLEGETKVRVRTTNATIQVALPEDDGKPLAMKVDAGGSTVRAPGAPTVQWEQGDGRTGRRARGQSPDYDQAHRKLHVQLETTNGVVEIR